MIDLISSKSALRKESFARRGAAHAKGAGAAEAARDHLLASRLLTGQTIISGYAAMRSELDPAPLMHALHGAGHTLCLPVVIGAGQPLKFREWTPASEMEDGAFGAKVPASGQWLTPDLLVVPLLAFDAAGWRLGYGGGFYDRTLEGLRGQKPTTAIGFAYAAQQVDSVPTEPTDQPLDAIVTEQGVQKIQRRGAA
jgi:5-formyltetrahydrofolate cyclo-ligase